MTQLSIETLIRSRHSLLLVIALTFVTLFSTDAVAQRPGNIVGTVVDANTDTPLTDANVFLSHTTRGTATRGDGTFEITNVPSGSYKLAASLLGYEAAGVQVELEAGERERVDFRLKPSVYALDELTVTADRPHDWRRNVERFEDTILGGTENAKESQILNEYVLDFEIDRTRGLFRAFAHGPLQIENRALGYRLTVLLDEFTWNPDTSRLRYGGRVFFEPLLAKDPADVQRWTEARRQTYRGSLQHLLRTLVSGDPFEEGFLLHRDPRLVPPHEGVSVSAQDLRPVDVEQIVQSNNGSAVYTLSFPETVRVTYFRPRDRSRFRRDRSPREQISWIKLATPFASVSSDGSYFPPGALAVHGYLAGRGLADLLPRDYGMGYPAAPEEEEDRAAELVPLGSNFIVVSDAPRPDVKELVEALRARRWRMASRLADDLVAQHPEDLESRYLKATASREVAKLVPYLEKEYHPTSTHRGRWSIAIKYFEDVVSRNPAYRDVLLQFALLWRYAGEYERALELAQRQLSSRPNLFHARYGLFQILKALTYHDPQQALVLAEGLDPDLAAYVRAQALRLAGKTADAEAALMNRFPMTTPDETPTPAELLSDTAADLPIQLLLHELAKLYYARGRTEVAQRYVHTAIDRIDGPLAAAVVFEDIKYIMTPDELEAYGALEMPEAFRAFFRNFWAERDPLPASPVNPRIDAHYRRLLRAEREFVFAGFPRSEPESSWLHNAVYHLNDAFNDKGLIYLRHGEPYERVSSLQGDLDTRSAPDAGQLGENRSTRNLMERIRFPNLTVRESWVPNESWRYYEPALDLHFVLDGSGNDWRLSEVLPLTAGILESRADWGGRYADLYLQAERILNQRAVARTSNMNVLNPALRPDMAQLESSVERLAKQNRDAIAEALATDRHTWPDSVEPMDVPFIAAAFRGADGASRLEIFYTIPTGLSPPMLPSKDSIQVEMGIALRDTSLRSVVQDARLLTLPRGDDPDDAVSGLVAVEAAPDSYHVAFHVRPIDSRLLAAYRFEKHLPDYSDRGLAISDVVLAHRVDLLRETDSPARSDFTIIPNPRRRFSLRKPVHVYFEVYNLIFGADDRTRYRVEYALSPLRHEGRLQNLFGRRDEFVLTVSTDREGMQRSATEYAEIDMRRVPVGRYRLEVTVTDSQTGESASRSTALELYKGSE